MLMESQQHLLVMLKEIDAICKKHNIPYYLGGGCLIGAIRNEGFLPWDDDADIHMTRENAMKFLSLKDEFPDNRVILCKETDENAPIVFWRYIDTSRTVYMRSTFYFDAPGGQFVDIFVLDPIKADEETIKYIDRQRQLYNEFTMTQLFIDSIYDEKFVEDYKKLKTRAKKEGVKAIRKEFEDMLETTSDEEGDYYLIRAPMTEYLPLQKKFWGTPKYVKFEDTYLQVPEKVEEWLLFFFGDRWIEVPPVVERGSHVFLMDSVLPYTVYKEEFEKYTDKQEIYDFSAKRKDLIMEHITERNTINSVQWMFFADIEKKKIETRLKEECIDLKYLVEIKDIKTLEDIFSGYYYTQFTRFRFLGLYFDIPDEWLIPATLPLIYRGRYNRVQKIFNLMDSFGEKKYIPEHRNLRELVKDLKTITNDIYVYRNYQNARKTVNKNIKNWSWVITLLRSDIKLMLLEKKEANLIKAKVVEYLRLYPRDGELLKYYADAEFLLGNLADSVTIYRKAKGIINNGIEKTLLKHRLEEIGHATG